MSKIDPEMLDQMDHGRGMESKRDSNGNVLAWRGPWLPDWFDNYTECLRENQNARRIQLLRDSGLNEHGQTKDQQNAFERKKSVQLIRAQKAEAALLASENISGGK